MKIFQSNDLVSMVLEAEYKGKPYAVRVSAEESVPVFCTYPITITIGVSDPDGSVEVICGRFMEGKAVPFTTAGVTNYAVRLLEEKGDELMEVYKKAIKGIKKVG